jgi:NAD(P)H-flavin reductase
MLNSVSLERSAVWLDGPFGTGYNLSEYGVVLLFASGTGVFACLPLIKGLIEEAKIGATKARKIKLIWQTNEFHDKLQEWMQSILDDKSLDPSVGPKPFAIWSRANKSSS